MLRCHWTLAVIASFVLSQVVLAHEDDRTDSPTSAVKQGQDEVNRGVLPAGADGKPLNLDFESGTLADWTTRGDAFKDQPVQGDIPSGPKARDKKAEPQGQFWIGTFERLNDAWGVAMSLNTASWIRTIFARYEGAGDLFERTLAASEHVGDELAIAFALSSLAQAQLSAGDGAEAHQTAMRALRLLRASSSSFALPDILDTLAVCCSSDGEYDQAAELLGAASALREAMRVPLWGPSLDRRERLEAELQGALGDDLFAAAQARGRARPIESFKPTRSDAPLTPSPGRGSTMEHARDVSVD